MNVRIGQAWRALNKMEKIWKSNLKKLFEIGFFRATVENVLLYGAESWTLTGKMSDRLDRWYIHQNAQGCTRSILEGT